MTEINSIGVRLANKNAKIAVSEGAHVSAELWALYYENAAGAVTMNNNGVLRAKYGVLASADEGAAIVRNGGRILAVEEGIVQYGARGEIINSGVIEAKYGVIAAAPVVTPPTQEYATRIVNSGKITGSEVAVSAEDVAVNIRNKGVLNGDVLLDNGNGQDILNNRGGVINGNVYGGNGDDVFKMVGGRLNGVIIGGNGDDVVTLSSQATVYLEYANEGIDTVRANSNYMLGANIEKLVLLGKADHTGIGNSLNNQIQGNKGDNALYGQGGEDILFGGKGKDALYGGGDNDWLIGGGGNDVMTGGDGMDMFSFNPGSGRDTIADFTNGADFIELSAYNFGGYTELRNAYEFKQIGDDVVIIFSDTDRLVIRDVSLNSIDSGDFVFGA